MKIVYIIKKGFQYYPPCLAQVLILNDLGMELEIYHGKNSEYIDGLLDIRQIKHYQLNSDNDAKGRVASIKSLFFIGRNLKRFYPVFLVMKYFGLATVNLLCYLENI